MLNTVDVLLKGRNRELLFAKLKRADVPILKVRNSGDGLIINIKHKDLKKAFAIFGNMWYNKPIRYHGAIAIKKFFIRHVAFLVAATAFVAFPFLFDDHIVFTEINGASQAKSLAITSLLKETGVKPFSKYSSVDTAGLKRAILSQDDKYDFVTVGKRGNTLLINVFERAPDAERAKEKSSITARESGVITYISVLRGTALKKVGDIVNAGETVIEGGAIDGETVFRDRAEGRFTIRCERSFEFPASDTDEKKANAEIARLKAFLDKEDALAEYSYKTSSGGFILVVKLIYSVTEGGEINEQNNG